MDVGGGSDRTRLNAFDQLLELVSGQVNNHIISLEEFKQKSSGGYQATKSPCLSSIIAKMCMHLGNWVQEIPNSYDLLFQMQAVAPNPFIRQVFSVKRYFLQVFSVILIRSCKTTIISKMVISRSTMVTLCKALSSPLDLTFLMITQSRNYTQHYPIGRSNRWHK
jgi:hypothetical protein